MTDGFTEGTMGIPTGSAMNSAGLMYYSAATGNSGEENTQKSVTLCKPNEVQWFAGGECFVPSQRHINALIDSLAVNFVLIAVIGIRIYIRRRNK